MPAMIDPATVGQAERSAGSARLAVQIWLVDLTRLPVNATTEACLDTNERSRAERFRFPADAQRFVAAHVALRQILAERVGLPAESLIFETNAYGKPFLIQAPDLSFNLSHSGDVGLCALAERGELGVDVERVRALDDLDMAERFFSEQEYQTLRELPVPMRASAFFACWTRKEAYIKAKGLGLSWPLDAFAVTCAPDIAPALLTSARAPDDVVRFRMQDIPVSDTYRAALAYAGPSRMPAQVQWWDAGCLRNKALTRVNVSLTCSSSAALVA